MAWQNDNAGCIKAKYNATAYAARQYKQILVLIWVVIAFAVFAALKDETRH